jgi:hypothetical protein
MKVTGSIPKNMMYISQAATEVGGFWENVDDQTATKIIVKPTFPADADNPKSVETGIKWGSGYQNKNKTPTTITRPNDPITNIRIVGLEIRSEGGRAYKVLLDGDLYVDLREDVLLDTMIQEGISKGGVLRGSFIWARVGSQMKLVRVGSELHDALIKNTNLGTLKKITTLEIGGVYRGKSPEEYIYLGIFDTINIDTKASRDPRTYITTKETTYKEINKHMLFIERKDYLGKTVEEIIKKTSGMPGSPTIRYLCKFKKSHSFVEKIDQVNAFDIQAYVDDLNNAPTFKAEYSLEYLTELYLIRPAGTPIRIPAPFQALFASAKPA